MMYHNVFRRFFAVGNEGGRLFVAPGRPAGVRQVGIPTCRGAGCAGSGRPPRPYNGLGLRVMRGKYYNVFGRKKPSRLGWVAFAFAAFWGRFCRQGIRIGGGGYDGGSGDGRLPVTGLPHPRPYSFASSIRHSRTRSWRFPCRSSRPRSADSSDGA